MDKVTLHTHLNDDERKTFVALLVLKLSTRRVEDLLNREYSIEVASKIQVILAHPTE